MSDICKHEKVVRRENGTWHCDWCEAEFCCISAATRDIRHAAGIEVIREISAEEAKQIKDQMDRGTGKIQFTPMPEVATLRDQFAMAAMISDAIQCAVIAAAHLGQGKTFKSDTEGLGFSDEAKVYYETADRMLEARR